MLRDGFQANRQPKITRVPEVVHGQYLNHVLVIDFRFDETADGRFVKILNVTDEVTREALSTSAGRRRSCVWITDLSSFLT